MKILTILGTRPEIIRLSRIMPLLDQFCHHVIVHTGQNYDFTLNEIFFQELGLRTPDYLLNCQAGSMMQEIGFILAQSERIILDEIPDRLLILGDTNSALAAMVAKRYGIPVYHMEAGNRCYDDRVPEEVNRRVIDHCSDILMPYTERSRANLIREGIPGEKIYVTGNPIKEVLDYYQSKIDQSAVLRYLNLKAGNYFLVTLHRAENVDIKSRLRKFIEAFHLLYDTYKIPIILSLHPRTRSQLEQQNLDFAADKVVTIAPLGLFDFVHLEKRARVVLSDSGTVQEECSLFRIPNITLRDVTERPETLEAGSNITAGCEPDSIINAVKLADEQSNEWQPPKEYLINTVSRIAIKIILSR